MNNAANRGGQHFLQVVASNAAMIYEIHTAVRLEAWLPLDRWALEPEIEHGHGEKRIRAEVDCLERCGCSLGIRLVTSLHAQFGLHDDF